MPGEIVKKYRQTLGFGLFVIHIFFLLFLFARIAQADTEANYKRQYIQRLQSRVSLLRALTSRSDVEVSRQNRAILLDELNRRQAAINEATDRVNRGGAAVNSPASPADEKIFLKQQWDLENHRIGSDKAMLEARDQRLSAADQSALTADMSTAQTELRRIEIAMAEKGLEADRQASAAAQTPAANASLDRACMERLESECITPTREAYESCDVEQGAESRIAQSDFAKYASMSTQVSSMAAAANATSGLTGSGSTGLPQACSTLAYVAAGANGALATYRMKCSGPFDTCKEKCLDFKKELDRDRATLSSKTGTVKNPCSTSISAIDAALKRADEQSQQCSRLAVRANESELGMKNAAASMLSGATGCIANNTAGGLEAYCKANPSAVVCTNLSASAVINCGDGSAAAAASTICICRANPYDSRCPGQQTSAVQAANGVIGGAPLVGTQSAASQDFNLGLDGQSPTASLTPGQDVGGRKMSLPGISGGDSLQADQGGGGGGRGHFDPFNGPKIFGKTSGGSGQGGWGSKGATGKGYGTGVYGKFLSGFGNNSALKDFLPNGVQDPNRGLASVDGILGPHVNIWEKISNRYVDQSVTKQSLLPSNYQASPQELRQRKPAN